LKALLSVSCHYGLKEASKNDSSFFDASFFIFSPLPWGRGTGLARWWGCCRVTPVVSVTVTASRGTPARRRFPSLKFSASPFESASRQRAGD